MADSVVTRPRGKSTTAASSPGIADRGDANNTNRKDSPSVEGAVNRKAMSEAALAQLALASNVDRSSVGIKISPPSTGSSAYSLLLDSTPTLEEDFPLRQKGPLLKALSSSQLQRADGDARKSLISGSPIPTTGKQAKSPTTARGKSSMTTRTPPLIPKRTSRPSDTIASLATERQRTGSAISISPEFRPGSSSDNPVHISDNDALQEVNDAPISAKKGRAASRTLERPTIGQMSQYSSAPGRLEERAISDISQPVETLETLEGRMDCEPPLDAIPRNPKGATVEELAIVRTVPKTSPTLRKSSPVNNIRLEILEIEAESKSEDDKSEDSGPDNARSSLDPLLEPGIELEADRDSRYPRFKSYNVGGRKYNDRETQVRLVKSMKLKISEPEPNGRGWIYVYTAAACEGHFKVGYTFEGIQDRIDQQKNCGLGELELIEDFHQRAFRYANHVERLVMCELYNHRRKFECKNCKSPGNGGPTQHEEWFEIEPERLLMAIEKWRGWITKNNPYNSNGALKSLWVWKLSILNENDDLLLDHILQPFTLWDGLSYGINWFWCQGRDLWVQGIQLYKAIIESSRLLLTASAIFFLVYLLGLWFGLVSFALLAMVLAFILSGQ